MMFIFYLIGNEQESPCYFLLILFLFHSLYCIKVQVVLPNIYKNHHYHVNVLYHVELSPNVTKFFFLYYIYLFTAPINKLLIFYKLRYVM